MQFGKVAPSPDITASIAIEGGRAGVIQTLKYMRAMVREYKRRKDLRDVAVSLTSMLIQKDWPAEVSALHEFVRDDVRYQLDPTDTEWVQSPLKTLETMSGDCDDKSTLLAALLESIGHPSRFVAVGFFPGELSHVFVQTKIGNSWVSLETTEPVSVGWSPDNVQDAFVVTN